MAASASSVRDCICHGKSLDTVAAKLSDLVEARDLSDTRRALARKFWDLTQSASLTDDDVHVIAVAARVLGARQNSSPVSKRSYAELQRIEPSVFKNQLAYVATGAWAQVFQGTRSGCPIIIKEYHKKKLPYLGMMFRNECEVHDSTDHPNLLNFYGVCADEHKWKFVVEKAEGDLSVRQARETRPSHSHGLCHVLQAAEAVAYLHGNGIVHGDICPENLFYDAGRSVKLGDLGYAFFERELSHAFPEIRRMIGEPSCAPPEAFADQLQSREGDIYRLGMTSLQLMTGQTPFPEVKRASQLLSMRYDASLQPDTRLVPKAYRKVVEAAVHVDPSKRPTAEGYLHRLLESAWRSLRTAIRQREKESSSRVSRNRC